MTHGSAAVAGERFHCSERWRRLLSGRNLVLAVVAGVIAYLALVPIGFLLWQTFVRNGHLTVASFTEAYSTVGLGELVLNSLTFALGSTVLATAVGTGLAYMVVRTNVPCKPLIFVGALAPLIIPGILHTIAWIFLASPQIGIFNQHVIEPAAGGRAFNVFSLPGMIVVEGVHLVPLVFLLMAASFRSTDPALEEAAVTSGASLRSVFFRITLPLARPALYAAILITVVRGLDAFEVPALLGLPNRTYVFTSRIWGALNVLPPDYGQAGAYAMSLLVLTSIGVFWYSRLAKPAGSYQTVTSKGFRPRPLPLGAWRLPALALIFLYLAITVIAPVLVLAYASTQAFYSPPSSYTLSHMSLDTYRTVIHDDLVVHALENTVIVGLGAATAVMLLTGIASWLVIRTSLPGRWLIDNLAFLPLTIPGLVLGVALLTIYLRVSLPIYGTLWILFIAYLTRYLPYGMRYSSASMFQIARELEETAQMSGAGWWQTFRRIVLPLMLPGFIAGWIYIVVVSTRELASSVLLYSPGKEVLPIVIWEQYRNGQLTELSALGIMMIGALVVLVALAYKLGATIGLREG